MYINEIIEGESVKLKSVDISDAEFTYKIRQDKSKTKYMHKVEGTIEDQKRWIENQRKREGDYFFLVLDENYNPIGTYGVYNIDMNKGKAETGRAILCGTPMQNLEAIMLFFDFCFLNLKIEKLLSYTAKDNISANGVAKKLGGSVISSEFNDELGIEMEWFLIDRTSYTENRDILVNLVKRFQRR